jgi:hypothetical protein
MRWKLCPQATWLPSNPSIGSTDLTTNKPDKAPGQGRGPEGGAIISLTIVFLLSIFASRVEQALSKIIKLVVTCLSVGALGLAELCWFIETMFHQTHHENNYCPLIRNQNHISGPLIVIEIWTHSLWTFLSWRDEHEKVDEHWRVSSPLDSLWF